MSENKPNIIDRSNQDFHLWLKEVAQSAGLGDDKNAAYHALRAVLHTVRDTLVPDEALDLASQLPTFIRGVYFEGYHIAGKPVPRRHKQDFLEAIKETLDQENSVALEPETAASAVLSALASRVAPGQAQHVRGMLHKEIQELFPEEATR